MGQIRKGAAALLALLLVCQVLAGCAAIEPPERKEEAIDLSGGFQPAAEEDELVKIDENSRFVLYANLSNGEAAVEDKRNGHTWYTNPMDQEEDTLAAGANRAKLQSILIVDYFTHMDVSGTAIGFTNSVRKGGLSYRLEEDGSVIFQFDFPKEEFLIPVRYAIEEDRFVAEVLPYGVWEYGNNKVLSIDLLPFFGAGRWDQEGYMLVPDGNGALIHYNNEHLANKYFGEDKETMYGDDAGVRDWIINGVALRGAFVSRENPYLPVFGVHQEDQGFLAVVSQGAARSVVRADISNRYTMYNTVWSAYYYRFLAKYQQFTKDGKRKDSNVAERKREDWENYQVSFYFLDRGASEYPDMARTYREYLEANQGLEQRVEESESIPLYLQLHGYLEKRKSFMGIPADVKISTATVEDANAILDQLEAGGASRVVMKYSDWAANSYYQKLPTGAKVDGKGGSATERLALQQRLAEAGGGLYLSADLMNVYQTGNGVSRFEDLLRGISDAAQPQYKLNPFILAPDSRYKPWNLLRPSAIAENFQKYASNLASAGYENLALDTVGEKLYSEVGSSGLGRNQRRQIIADTLGALAEQAGLLVTGANDYVAVHATHILETSSGNSGFDIVDTSIPFYQMVLHGYASYSLEAINLSSNLSDMTLKCLESGAYPLYILIGQNADELIGSRSDHLYSVDAANWLDFALGQYTQLNEALRGVQTSVITDHRILAEGVRAVAYENGTVIYVNYTERAVQAEGVQLQPRGYAVVADGAVVVNAAVESN